MTTPYARQEKLALRAAVPDRKTVPRYGRLELALDLSASFQNPFDPEEIDAWAVFTSPKGRAVRVNGFYDRPFKRRLVNGEEKIEPAGEPGWKVRFSPDVTGTWRYRVYAKDRTGTASLPEARLRVTTSKSRGFIRRSARNPLVFAYEDGVPFFAVGENVCWGGKRGSFDYDDWMPPLGKSGGNWIRFWMASWNCALEWSAESKGEWRSGGYHGVGIYSLDNAWKLDTILDTCERNGISVMLCFGTYGEFTDGGFFNEGQWKANPYNRANGGPCTAPTDFWTNAEARKLYRRRLRYIAARYGYRTGIHSWEFWNEVPSQPAWTAEMARYLKGTGEFNGQGADPYHHLVTTSYGNAELWKTPEIDFSQSHSYGTANIPDHAPVIHNDAAQHITLGKPHLMAEFGIDYRKPDEPYDPDGHAVNLHNGLWSSMLSGNAGTGMVWWWDSYVHPKNLYRHFIAVRKFADAVPWTSGAWKPLEADAPRVTGGPQTFADLTLPAGTGWGRSAVTEFVVTPERGVGLASLPSFLYSPGKPDLRTTPRFRVRYERPGRFVVRVGDVSTGGRLRFLLNGKPAQEHILSAAPVKPGEKAEYEKTEFVPEYGIYRATFNRDYGIDVPAGDHVITLEVTEGDWIGVESYTLTNYTSSRFPRINLYGLTDGKMAILWAQNAEYNWKNVFEKKPIPDIKRAETAVRGLPAGRYTVEWWDTMSGEIVRRDLAVSKDGALSLSLPDLPSDIAARIIPVSVRGRSRR